jgi:acyl-CoA thioester hydrolase
MSDVIEKTFEVRWDDVNSGGILRNTRYLEYASYARISYFQNAGFPVSRMHQMGLDMVVLADEAEYCNEVFLAESVTVRARAVGLSADGTRWQVAHTFLHSDGKIAAILYTLGAWYDINARKPTAPPPELKSVMDTVRSADCEVIT